MLTINSHEAKLLLSWFDFATQETYSVVSDSDIALKAKIKEFTTSGETKQWKPFRFDTGNSRGLINNYEEWQTAKSRYSTDFLVNLYVLKACKHQQYKEKQFSAIPTECDENTQTLAEFFEEHGMEL